MVSAVPSTARGQKMKSKFKLTITQADVLKAYRDNTTHNRSSQIADGLRRRGLLVWEGSVFNGGFRLTRSGLQALEAHERGTW